MTAVVYPEGITKPTTDVLNQGNRPGDGPLRPGGVSLSSLPSTGQSLPSTMSPAAARQASALRLVRDLWAGPEQVRKMSTTYLPQSPGEDPENYRDRLERSVFFNVFGHTVGGMTGFVFRRDPVVGDDVPQQIQDHLENVDLCGTHFDVFARELLQDAMIAGHAAILVDYPDTKGVRLTLADELPLRPYWIPIKKDDILSWRTSYEDGRQVLTQVVLRETQWVADGTFGQKEQTQYRVLYRARTGTSVSVGFQVLAIGPNNVVTEVSAGLYPTQDEIPIAEVVTAGRKGMFESDPPLLDLAYLNIAHYQQWSDYANSLHKTCVPIFTTIGLDQSGDTPQALVLGPNSAINLPLNGKAEYVSHSGQALAACKAALNDLEDNMASLGIAMLAGRSRVAETAEAKRIGKADTDSALSVTARGLQDGLERALDFHAKYLRLEDGGSIEINRDYENLQMDAPTMMAWSTLAEKLNLPVRFVLEALQEGGRIPDGTNLDEVEREMAANQVAAADRQAQEAKDAIALAKARGLQPGQPGQPPVPPAPPAT